jgi:hypothetical protein
MADGGWTLDELAERVARALAADDVRAPNARITEVPNRRVIRWYATIGLVDRPLAARGRAALYGPRHLLQIVAVKRRQAEGHTLAQIQAELTGATDATLRRVAAVPDELLDAPAGSPDGHREVGRNRERFWSHPSTTPAPAPAGLRSEASASERAGEEGARPWAPGPARAERAPVLSALFLDGGALLVLPVQPDPADVPAIHAAATPLLDLLAARGLLAPTTARSRR